MQLNKKNNQSGLTLIEVIVTISLLAIVALGSFALIPPVMSLKRRMETSSGINTVTNYIKACVNSDFAWYNTIQLNPDLQCLKDGTPCVNGTQGNIRLYEGSGDPNNPATLPTPCFNYDPLIEPRQGFTQEGELCTGYVPTPGAGNANCPYYLQTWYQFACPLGLTECKNPVVKIGGTWHFNGPDQLNELNRSRFNFSAIRGRGDLKRSFVIYEVQLAGVDGGSCAGGGSYRKFNVVHSDPTESVLNVNPTTGQILLAPGTYECEISAPAYLVGNHQISLVRAPSGTVLLHGTSEYAPSFWGFTSSRSYALGVFTLDVSASVGVLHYCATMPTDASLVNKTLGVSTNVGPEIYAMMRCRVLAK